MKKKKKGRMGLLKQSVGPSSKVITPSPKWKSLMPDTNT